ncbi:deazaflavin-dependent oxidoreductase (nitroreductase family) [Williamsia limnetica]|uniref:Deazaflavin-dependent oxidoreductase (Nitroreductase family) n=1 Tax=Williamsia limnetica TaxID=882452 RepID=A0A318RLR4_WILLI|nr:nitroreductase family deazaflavin-dependent oxidoreductase [Williamsia limnetica]PYE16485.1 deazaflavin-dependent oxidoreductase (nitroreductase family) [Williamsia limnetica]
MTKTVSLSTPLDLPCGQILPNRIMKSALSEGLGTAHHAPDVRLERLYARWAAGDYGLIVTGNVMVDRRYLGEPGNVVLENDSELDAFQRWAKTAQDGGSPIWMQLNHPGRQANPITTDGPTVAPSAVKLDIPGIPTPRELTDTEIRDVIERFAVSAGIAEVAGFDGVQIHGAHGYLISQFLSPLANKRSDRWGGSTANRARFVLEIIRRVREAVGPGFAVGIKLNSADFQRGGFSEEESRTVVEMIAAERIDLIEISGGSYESPAMMGRPAVSARTRAREAYFLDYAETIREVAADVPLAVTGGFRTHTGMADAIASGACDVVGLGRPTALAPKAAQGVMADTSATLPTTQRSVKLPRRLTGTAQVKALNGALDLQWHTDQLHTMGAGGDPDPHRPLWRTAVTTVRRNGIDAFRSQRGHLGTSDKKAVRKFRIERAVGRYVANPVVAALTRVGITTTFATELETIGRRTGLRRTVPVSAAFDETGAWVISQHGARSGWANNISANPTVRIKQGRQWRSGTAELVHDDDVTKRVRTFAPNPVFASLTAASFRALQSDPVSVRISFTDR